MKRSAFVLRKKHLLLQLIIMIATVLICLVMGIYFFSFLLGPPKLTQEQNTFYYSHDGELIGEERGSESRYWVGLDELPDDLIQATLAVEDKRFYDHQGFDLKRIAKAILLNVQHGSLKEGASTLTQQYARNLYLSHEKTWSRKIKEAFYTIRLEMYYTKDEILEGYLNTVYFGHGAYGIEAASRYFFNKSASELTLAEAAMMIGIPKGPTYYSPLNDLEKATNRQEQILNLMLEQERISRTDHDLAVKEHLTYFGKKETDHEVVGSHFQDTVLREVSDLLNIKMDEVKSGGYHIYTTLRTDLQKKLEGQIADHIKADSEIDVAAVTMDPATGAIYSLVGGRSYETSPFNRATSAVRMTGSTFKPFLYYAALENNYTASTRLMSKPTAFTLEGEEVYQPRNFNGYYADQPISLAQALALSDNIYAVKTHLFLGADKLVQTARTFGISGELPAVPSLALGTASSTVSEMVTAYSMLANGGRQVASYTVDKVVDQRGKVVFSKKRNGTKQVLDPSTVAVLTQLLTGMFDPTLDNYMPVTGSSIAEILTRPYAGKSGSTPSDSWMIGYSPSLVTGVWTGYDDNRSIESVPEMAYAKEIWAHFMAEAHQTQPVEQFFIPSDVSAVQIDPATGQIATPYCDTTRIMYFKKGTEPTRHCMTHFPGDENNPQQDVPVEDDRGVLERLFDLLR